MQKSQSFCLHGLSGSSGGSVGRNHGGVGSGLVGRGRGVGHWLNLVHVLGVSVVDLLADLLGEGQLDGLASGSGQLGDAEVLNLDGVLNLGDGDALLHGEILARDPDQVNGLLDTSLDGLGVGDLHVLDIDGDNGDVVAGLLGDLLAVVVAVLVVAVAGGGLAHGHHLGVALPGEGNGDGLGGGGLGLLAVGVHADLVLNNLNALAADGTGHGVALLLVNDDLGGHLDLLTDSLESRSAHLSRLNNINDAAVVLGGGVGVVDRGVHNSVVGNGVVGNGMVGNGVVGNTVVGHRVVRRMVDRGSMVDGMVGHRGMVHSMVGQGGMVEGRGGVVHSMGNRRMDCMVGHRGVGNGATGEGGEGGEWNLGLWRSQGGGEESGHAECLKFFDCKK